MAISAGLVLLALYACSAALAGAVLLAAFRAERLTGQPHLRAFIAGFALLMASYLAVLLNRLVWPINWGYHTTLWLHELAQLAAFVLLAASYQGRGGGLTRRRVRTLEALAIAGIALAALAFLALPPGVAWSGRDATALPIYLAAALPLGYVLLQAARGLRDRGRGAVLVPAGFATWAVGQVFWMLWAVTHAWILVVVANVAFVAGLAMFAAALRPAWRRHGVPRAA